MLAGDKKGSRNINSAYNYTPIAVIRVVQKVHPRDHLNQNFSGNGFTRLRLPRKNPFEPPGRQRLGEPEITGFAFSCVYRCAVLVDFGLVLRNVGGVSIAKSTPDRPGIVTSDISKPGASYCAAANASIGSVKLLAK